MGMSSAMISEAVHRLPAMVTFSSAGPFLRVYRGKAREEVKKRFRAGRFRAPGAAQGEGNKAGAHKSPECGPQNYVGLSP